jgi:uncharacterized protein involved in type VI secretion and phage assembly
MGQRSDLHVASAEVLVSGAPLPPELAANLTEIKVKQSVAMPSSAVLKFASHMGEDVDNSAFDLGKELEIKLGPQKSQTVTSLFKGEIAAFEPEFLKDSCVITVRAYDKSHKLQRSSKVRTFQKMTASDIIRKVLGESGLSGSKIAATTVKYEFFQQSGETDRQLIRRFERDYDHQFFMDNGVPTFRPASETGGPVATLTWGEQLLTFRPRISGAQQVKQVQVRGWDLMQKAPIVGSSQNSRTVSKPGLDRAKVSRDSGAGDVLVVDRMVDNRSEADRLAKSAIDGRAEAYVEAEGSTLGDPKLLAGKAVKIAGVGTKLSGEYALTSVTHWYRATKGYYTHFEISGRSPRGLLDLVHPPEKRDWASQLVIGIVTNANDPEKLGRVKVKYPALSDSEESYWARIVTLGAGQAKGVVMLPEANDEVVVAFENGDPRRPLVIGSLFGGKAKPSDELLQKGKGGKYDAGGLPDGSFGMVAKNRGFVHTAKDLTFKSDQKLIVEISSDIEEKTSANLKSEASSNAELKAGTNYTVQAGSTLTLKGVQINVEASGPLKLKGATVDIEASGPATLKGATVNVQGSAVTNIKGGIVNLG